MQSVAEGSQAAPGRVAKVRAAARALAKTVANRAPTPFTVADYFVRFKLTHTATLSRYPQNDQTVRDHIARIDRDGYTVVENYLTPAQCDAGIADIEWMLEHKKEHVLAYSDRRVFGAEELSTSIASFYNDPKLGALSNAYNCVKTVNAFTLANKVVGSPGNTGSGEGWHKDSSFRQFKAILYLNDVGENNGPFQLIRNSHTLPRYLQDMRAAGLPFRELRITDAQIERILAPDPSRLTTVTGRKGTLILVDTASIHRGRPAREGVRYALTNYYVERSQITSSFVRVFRPVSPEKVMRLRDTWD